jgi:predicted DCC family thiol-disulfide oxidoreductase YuxK
MDPGHPIIVFDGVCNLCNGWVAFVLKRDESGQFRFSAMQTAAGRRLLQDHGLDPDLPASFLLLDGHLSYVNSDGILAVLKRLGAPWTGIAIALSFVPRCFRDGVYRFVARHRYRLFGRRSVCMLPSAELRGRFIT